MPRPIIILVASIILSIAYVIARNAHRNGYHFWRTWFMSTLGLTSLLLLFLKLIG